MNVTEKSAYLKGLAEGLGLDPQKPETKIINALFFFGSLPAGLKTNLLYSEIFKKRICLFRVKQISVKLFKADADS